MAYHLDDTIAAIASAPGGAARGIVRISGPRTLDVLNACFQPALVCELAAIVRATVVGGFISLELSPTDNVLLLPADLYFWPDARSYTREPAAEIHTLGSPPLLAVVLKALCTAGARTAEPGEFTLRAFLAGRIDLTQAEAVLGVVDAAGPAALQGALSQLAGNLARPLHALRDELVDLLADLEAGLDFVEEDIEFVSSDEVARRLRDAAERVAILAAQMSARGQSVDRIRVVLRGWPNVGKSSLFNRLAAGANALVADEPGTTRDYLTAEINDQGVRYELIDTAGIELDSPSSEVSSQTPLPPDFGEPCRTGEAAAAARPRRGGEHSEPGEGGGEFGIVSQFPSPQPSPGGRGGGSVITRAAQQMSRLQHERADVVVLCLDSTRPLNGWESEQLAAFAGRPLQYSVAGVCDPGSIEKLPASKRPATVVQRPAGAALIIVLTKCDLTHLPSPLRGRGAGGEGEPQDPRALDALKTSVTTGHGIRELAVRLRTAVLDAGIQDGEAVAATAARCGESLRLAAESLQRACRIHDNHGGEELLAAEIRTALVELGKIAGVVYTDDILDRIFSRFCIGK